MPESVPLPLKGTLVNQTQLERQVANVAKKAGKNLKIDLGTNAKDIKSLEQPLGRITGQADEFGKSMQAANARVIAFGASVGIINAVVQSFKSLVSTTIEVEASLAKINSILNTTVSGLDNLKGQIFDIARNTQQTFDTVANAALELSRQGLSATEVTKRLNDSLILSRLAGIDAAEAVAGLTAAVNSFSKEGLTTGDVLNKISNAANQFAVSERDLIEGFKRSASVAQQAGVSIDELGGIITAVQQKTARGGAVIGNSFKTIFTRIGRAENLDLLESLGVQITDVSGKILPATKLIENLAGRLKDLNDVQVRSVTEKIGGGFQIAPLIAALSDYSSETSIAIKATDAFRSATDQAYQKNIILNETLSAAISRTSLNIKELANNLGELGVTDAFKEILGFVNSFANTINKLLEAENPGATFAKNFLSGLGNALIKGGLALFGVLLFELSKQLFKFGVDSLKTFLGLNKEAEKLKNIQQQIVGTLLTDKGVRENILRIENSSLSAEQKRAQQAEFFNIALRERVKLTSQLNTISSGIAPGITARSRSGSVRRSADGFLPIGAEQSDISRGVGGAPSSAKPVVIPNFAFGMGKKGTMVANDSEYIVPNFAGGGSAIFNQDMVKSMGLPVGAKKINAAGGYIPNFAKTTADQANFNEWVKSQYPKAIGTSGRWSSEAFNKNYNTNNQFNSGELKKLYTSSPLRQTWDTYGVGKKQTLAIQASQKKAFAAEGGASQYGVLFPDALGKSKAKNISVGGDYSVKAIPISTDPPDALYEEIREDLVKSAVNYAANIGLKPDSILKDEQFKTKVNQSLNEGSVRSAFGSVFESAFQASLGRPIGKSNEVWDLDEKRVAGSKSGKTGEITDLINSFSAEGLLSKKVAPQIRDLVAADFKNTLSEGNIESLKQKILKTQTASSGYIPNYAMSPLEDAIQREKEAGVPVNQIRINQDGKLRNSQNPDGLAVTNTRDEPTGRIPRNAAGGFIPNYQGGGFGPNVGAAKQTEKTNTALKGLENQAKNTGEATQDQAVAAEKSTLGFIKLSSLFFLLQGAIGGVAEKADGLGKNIGLLAEGALTASSTFFALQAAGLGPGKIKSKAAVDPRGLKQAKIAKGGLGGILAKVTLGLSRFAGPIGLAVTGFALLNPLLKEFGVDILGEVGQAFKKFGRLLGFVDTPAEAAAKALDKLNESSVEAALQLDKETSSTQDRIKTLELAIKGFDKGKDGEKLTTGQIINQALKGPEGQNQRSSAAVSADLSLVSLLSKEDKEALSKAPQDVQKFVNAQLAKLSKSDLAKRQETITAEERLSGQIKKAEEEGDEARLKQLNIELNEQFKIRDKIEDKVRQTNKEDEKSKVIANDAKKILGEVANIRLKSAIAQQKALAAIKTETEFSLELQKASTDTNKSDDTDIDRRIKNLQIEKDLQQQISDIFTQRILDNRSVQNVLAPDAQRKVDEQIYKDINEFVLQTNSALLEGAELEGSIAKFVEVRLKNIDGIAGKEKEIVEAIKSEFTAAKKLAEIAKTNNDLESARLKIIQAQAAEERNRDRLVQKGFDRARNQRQFELESLQQQLDIDRQRFETSVAGRKETAGIIKTRSGFDARQSEIDIKNQKESETNALRDRLGSLLKDFSDVIPAETRIQTRKNIETAPDLSALGNIETFIESSIKTFTERQKQDAKNAANAAKTRLKELGGTITTALDKDFGTPVKLFGNNVAKFGEYVDQVLAKERPGQIKELKESVFKGTAAKKEEQKIISIEQGRVDRANKSIKSLEEQLKVQKKISEEARAFIEKYKDANALEAAAGPDKVTIEKFEAAKEDIKREKEIIADLERLRKITEDSGGKVAGATERLAIITKSMSSDQAELLRLTKQEASAKGSGLFSFLRDKLKGVSPEKREEADKKTAEASEEAGTNLSTLGSTVNLVDGLLQNLASGIGRLLGQDQLETGFRGLSTEGLSPKTKEIFDGYTPQQQAPFLSADPVAIPPGGFGGTKSTSKPPKEKTDADLVQDRLIRDAETKRTLQILKSTEALKNFTGSLKTLASLIRAEFENIGEQRAQNTFDILTTADTGTLQSAVINQGRLDILENGEGTELDRIKQANEYVLRREKELEVLRTIDTATRSQLEYEYQINLKILALREKLNAAKTTQERDAILNQAAVLERQKDNPDLGELFKRQGKSPEESAKELRELLVQGASDFVDTLSDGMVDALSKGASLRDVLRDAATSFLEDFAKTSLNNLLRGVIFGQGQGGFPGILGSIFGQKNSDGGGQSGGGNIVTSVLGSILPGAGGGAASTGGSSLMNSSRGLSKQSPLYVQSTDGEGLPTGGGEGEEEGGGIDAKAALLKLGGSVLGTDLSALGSLTGGSKGSKGTQGNPVFVSVVNGGGGGGGAGINGRPGGGGISGIVGSIPVVGQFLGPILGAIGFNQGGSVAGRVKGGSGVRDDVPAVLMAGEYVIKKSSVQKYGSGLMESINSGNLSKFADGGMVENPGDPINEYMQYRRSTNNADRTQSGVLASDWTPKASTSKEDEQGKTINQEERTDSGIIASRWTMAASIDQARERERKNKVRMRTESGLESSDWTPAADSNSVTRREERRAEGERTESGVVASRWTSEAGYSQAKNPQERLQNEELRSDSGLYASKWTDSANFAKRKTERFEESNRLKTESGVESSDWTPKADVISERKERREADENRTRSGLLASEATPYASASEVYKPEERLKNKELRSDSGGFASRWTNAFDFIKEKKEKTDETVKFRSESGLTASEATPKAGLDQSFDPKVGEVLDKRLSNLKISNDQGKNSVPSMLTGGEFVMSKDTVSSMGTAFLDALNKGAVKKFSRGGLIPGATFAREEEDFVTTDVFGYKSGNLGFQQGSEFIIPGLYGQGAIQGAANLRDFATQGFTSGRFDVINQAAGASMISLEPESVRLTNFGRMRQTPLQLATQQAKGEAFGLNLEYQKQVAEYNAIVEEIKKQEKERKKALLTQLAISLVTMGAGAAISGIGAAGTAGGATKFSWANVMDNGFWNSALRGAPGATGSGNNIGGLLNLRGWDTSSYNLGGTGATKFATGGYVGGRSSDTDSVAALLSGGEFVLNRAATERMGQENLQNINSGGESQDSEKVVEKLDELLQATKDNSGEINITVNGGGGGGNQGGGSSQGAVENNATVEKKGANSSNKYREELAKTIKQKVLEVLREEKRLGGTLR